MGKEEDEKKRREEILKGIVRKVMRDAAIQKKILASKEKKDMSQD